MTLSSILGRIVAGSVSPLTIAAFLLGWAGFSAISRRTRFVNISTAAFLLIFASGPVSRALLRSLESRYPALNYSDSPLRLQAVVVLGGGLANSSNGTLQLGSSGVRLWLAAQLYRSGIAPLIVVSGGSSPDTFPESAAASQILQTWGIPTSSILTEQKSRDTRQNAAFTQKILAERKIDRIILVTSAFHMIRASAAFRKLGLAVLPAPTDFRSYENGTPFPISLFPEASALADSGTATKEWLGLLVYRLRGWA